MEAFNEAFRVKIDDEQLLQGISDLGGVTVDLQGGSFKFSTPIRFPPGIGNILVRYSSLIFSFYIPRLVYLFCNLLALHSIPVLFTGKSRDPKHFPQSVFSCIARF